MGVSSEAKDFINKCFIRAPEMHMTATDALAHTWLSEDYSAVRKKISLDIKDVLKETDERLLVRRKRITSGDRSNFEHSPRRNTSHQRSLMMRNKSLTSMIGANHWEVSLNRTLLLYLIVYL